MAPQESAVKVHPGSGVLSIHVESKSLVLPFPGPFDSPNLDQRAGLCLLPSLRGSSRLLGAIQELPPSSQLFSIPED